MIVIKVELHSANSRLITTLMRMHITNDGTIKDPKRGNYIAHLFRKGALTRPKNVTRTGYVKDFPRHSYHIGRLVLRALADLFPEERSHICKGDKT